MCYSLCKHCTSFGCYAVTGNTTLNICPGQTHTHTVLVVSAGKARTTQTENIQCVADLVQLTNTAEIPVVSIKYCNIIVVT